MEYFYNFMVHNKKGPGPVMEEAPLEALLPGDIVQLRFSNSAHFGHCPVVVAVRGGMLLLAAHSIDSDNRPLSTYPYEAARGLHVLGVWVLE